MVIALLASKESALIESARYRILDTSNDYGLREKDTFLRYLGTVIAWSFAVVLAGRSVSDHYLVYMS